MTSLIERALKSRRVIFQGAIIATLIAMGVNLISSWLVDYFKEYSALVLLSGALFVLIGFLYFIQQLLTERHQSLTIDGVILLNGKIKAVVGADDYGFSERLAKTLNAVFIENEALKLAWEREMFPDSSTQKKPKDAKGDKTVNDKEEIQYYSIVKMDEPNESDVTSKPKILLEAIEFCFLDYLSMHLSEYFDQREHDAQEIAVLERENIPHMVLANRILSLLTTPIEDRQIFTKSGMNKHPPKNGEIHAIYASNGAVYEKFHLALPVNTTISRPAPGELTLNHPRFQLKLHVSYQNFTKNLPTYFSDLYVSDSIENLDARHVHISLSATLHPLAFIHINGWEYYQWIDSFFEYLNERTSFDVFLQRIDWNSVATRIRAGIIRDIRITKEKEATNAAPIKQPVSEALH